MANSSRGEQPTEPLEAPSSWYRSASRRRRAARLQVPRAVEREERQLVVRVAFQGRTAGDRTSTPGGSTVNHSRSRGTAHG